MNWYWELAKKDILQVNVQKVRVKNSRILFEIPFLLSCEQENPGQENSK